MQSKLPSPRAAATSYHAAHWGKSLVIISTTWTALCSGLAIWLAQQNAPPHLILLPLLLPLGALPFAITGYTVSAEGLRIHRLGWDSVIPRSEIRRATLQNHALGEAVRTFGNGGLFSFSGRFWQRELGHFRAYVTDLEHTVVLTTLTGTVVISPAKPESFLYAISRV